jgi:hypothetical protein
MLKPLGVGKGIILGVQNCFLLVEQSASFSDRLSEELVSDALQSDAELFSPLPRRRGDV